MATVRRAITFTAKLNGQLLPRIEAGGYADGCKPQRGDMIVAP